MASVGALRTCGAPAPLNLGVRPLMNARRIHELMQDRFPAFNFVDHEWINVADSAGVRGALLQKLLDQAFQEPELLVEVNRRIGKALPKGDVVAFIGQKLGQGQIKIANRDFTAFAVVAVNGVATSWSIARAATGACDAQ